MCRPESEGTAPLVVVEELKVVLGSVVPNWLHLARLMDGHRTWYVHCNAISIRIRPNHSPHTVVLTRQQVDRLRERPIGLAQLNNPLPQLLQVLRDSP